MLPSPYGSVNFTKFCDVDKFLGGAKPNIVEKFGKFLGLTEGQIAAASNLYSRDPSSRLELLRSLASSRELDRPGLIPCDLGKGLGEMLCLICLRFPVASEESEPLLVASFISMAGRHPQPLPLVSEDGEVEFCAKTLVSLAVFMEAMIARTERRGSPSPGYYRGVAKGILSRKSPAHRALGAHHEAWEGFIHENFCLS
jgi:hypothetical protein